MRRKQEEQQAERNRKEREERMKLLLEWRQRKEEEEARELQLESQRAGSLQQEKRDRSAFLRVQREKIVLFTQTNFAAQKRQEKESKQQMEVEAAQYSASIKEQEQKRVSEMLEQERVKREQEVKLKADFTQLFNRQDITAVVTDYSPTLEVLFDYYAKVSAKEPLQAFVMLLPGLNKLTQDFKIVPAVLSLQEVVQLFRMFTKEKVTVSGAPIGLEPREFKESLVRIAAVGQKEIATLTGAEPPAAVTVQGCTADTLKGLFRFMSLPTDPKRTLDLLKKMNLEPPLHPREKKRLISKTPV